MLATALQVNYCEMRCSGSLLVQKNGLDYASEGASLSANLEY
jgi:hypothetical protein